MIINEVRNVGTCFACYNSGAQADSPYLNKSGVSKQRFGYAVMGTGSIRYHDLGVSLPFVAGDFFDVRAYKTSTDADIEITSDVAMCIVFSVEDPSLDLEATLLTPGTYTLTKGSTAETVFVASGTVTAGGAEIPAKKFAYLPEDRAVEVVIPEGAVAIHFKAVAR
jgi:hypothetical protein